MAEGVHAFLVTTPPDEHFDLWLATAPVSNWIEGRAGRNGTTWQVMVMGGNGPAFLEVARKLGGVTVEEIEGAGDDERFVLVVGEPGTGWKPPRCEHRHPNEEPCGAQGAYIASVGTRRHDAQVSCRRHLAATVDTLRGTECRGAEIIVKAVRRD